MPPKRRRKRKRREKRLERVPEKLQRRRERRVTYRIRRMPNWIKGTLVIAVIAVIFVAVVIAWISLLPPVPSEKPLADVYFLQQDIFYFNVDADSNLTLDSMVERFGIASHGSEDPLNFSIVDTFDEDHNFTIENTIAWDYFGNAYLLNPIIEDRSINFTFNDILLPINTTRELEGAVEGYWSLLFGYTLDSANDEGIRDETLDDFITSFNCTVEPETENGQLVFNNWTLVECNISLSTYPVDTIGYSYGRARLEFPRQVYDGDTLLANISIYRVEMTGTSQSPNSDYTETEETISFDTDFTFMGNDAWGFVFWLNVTTFTEESFCLLDLATEQCEFYLQAGYQETPYNPDQPMHFPKATLDVTSPYNHTFIANYTDIHIQLPQIWVEVNSTAPTPTLFLQQRTSPMRTSCDYRFPTPINVESQSRRHSYNTESETLFEPLALTAPRPVLVYLRRAMLF